MERYPVSTLVTCFLHNVASDVYLYMLYYACNPHNVYAVHDIVYVNRELAPALRISHNVLCTPDVKVYRRIFPESIACSERLQKLKKKPFCVHRDSGYVFTKLCGVYCTRIPPLCTFPTRVRNTYITQHKQTM